MTTTLTRETHKQYCLRSLGAPVIRINVDDSQLEDRIDEAIEFYRLYHFDGIVKTYLKHQVVDADKTNGFIAVNPLVYGVTKVFNFNSTYSNNSLFGVNFQLRIQDIFNLSSVSVAQYSMAMQHIQLLDDVLVGHKIFRFNRQQSKIYLDQNWSNIRTGDYLLAEVYLGIDPDVDTYVWNDPWLKRYTTALFKRQWGAVLKKMGNMQLPGGVVMNGQALYDEAQTEIINLENDMKNKSAVLEMYLG